MCNTQGDTPIRLKRRPIAQSIENLDQLMNLEKGRMSRDLFWDQDIYEHGMERSSPVAGCLSAHESQIPKAGDYVSTYMGEDNVLIVARRTAA
jgi:ethylbenzene dioxygenase alpha subunit